MKFRPWGPIDWGLALSGPKDWKFVGSLGTEERSLCSWKHLKALGCISAELFVEIADVDTQKYRDRNRLAIEERRNELVHHGGILATVEQLDLMAELFLIADVARRSSALGPSVILDITSFPKRFFFPILRALNTSAHVRNLILTYTSPGNYTPDDEPLYEDIEPWRVLPGFGGLATAKEVWVVSVGFLVESLHSYFGGNPDREMKVLVPFPAPLGVLRRTWEAVANLERDYSDGRFEKFRVEPLDISGAFDRLCSLAGNPEKPLALAPFGPKPTSAAMCLYATQKDSSVHYAQPTVYHPEYSRGIRGGHPPTAISAYWIKHEGENLYAV